MKRVLFFLGYLSDQDIEWLIKFGLRKNLTKGEVLIRKGEEIENLYIVLSGEFTVNSSKKEVARVSTGEVLGEMSFIEAKKPEVDVISNTESEIFFISKKNINPDYAVDIFLDKSSG